MLENKEERDTSNFMKEVSLFIVCIKAMNYVKVILFFLLRR